MLFDKKKTNEKDICNIFQTALLKEAVDVDSVRAKCFKFTK